MRATNLDKTLLKLGNITTTLNKRVKTNRNIVKNVPPTGVNRTVSNTDANVTMLATNLDQTLLQLGNITSNLNQQVQSNSNIVKNVSDMIVHADEFVQGLKRHWLLRSAFKNKDKSEEKKEKEEQRTPPPAKAGKWR